MSQAPFVESTIEFFLHRSNAEGVHLESWEVRVWRSADQLSWQVAAANEDIFRRAVHLCDSGWKVDKVAIELSNMLGVATVQVREHGKHPARGVVIYRTWP